MPIFKKDMSIMGTPFIKEDGEKNNLIIQYRTRIYSNSGSVDLRQKLEALGFEITETANNSIHDCNLPIGWMHVYLNKNKEVIIDSYHRKRILLDRNTKTCKILSRFNFGVEILTRGNEKSEEYEVLGILLYITDSGKIIDENFIDGETYKIIKDERCGGSHEETLEAILFEVKNILDEIFQNGIMN